MSVIVTGLSKIYGKQKALDGISFQIKQGEIVGLLGPNGAGKTTTMKIISGFMDDFEGDARIGDFDVRSQSLQVKKIIGYLPEHNPLYLEMYVKEYLQFVAGIYRLDRIQEKVDYVIHNTGLEKEQNKLIRALSKGYRQRVGLAQSLIHDPQILILDEPTTGLDPNQLIEIRQLILSLAKSKTIIFSSHIMQEVQALCQRVIILSAGSIVADDKIEYLDRVVKQQREIFVELDQPYGEKWKIQDLEQVIPVSVASYRLIFKRSKSDPRPAVFDFILSKGRKILEMSERKISMEDVFQKVTF